MTATFEATRRGGAVISGTVNHWGEATTTSNCYNDVTTVPEREAIKRMHAILDGDGSLGNVGGSSSDGSYIKLNRAPEENEVAPAAIRALVKNVHTAVDSLEKALLR